MKKYSYIYCPEILQENDVDAFNKFKEICTVQNCINIIESVKDEGSRPELESLLGQLKRRDSLVIFSLGNLLKSQNSLSYFFSLIMRLEIDFESVADHIQISYDEHINNRMDKKWGFILSFLPYEIGVCKNTFKQSGRKQDSEYKKRRPNSATTRRIKYTQTKIKALNMYKQGYEIKDILSRCNYRDKRSLYMILEEYNIERKNKKKQ